MPEAVIVDAARSPIGRAFKGSLAQLRPDETATYVVDRLLERNPDVAPETIEDVFCGCGMPQGLQAFNIARIIALLSERLPQTVTGVTFSRYCASSLDAIRHAANAVKAGEGDAYVAAGSSGSAATTSAPSPPAPPTRTRSCRAATASRTPTSRWG